MARGSIISSAKAIPGAQGPSASPQGLGNGYIGSISPMARGLDTGGSQDASWTNAYRAYLPRPANDFVNGAFGPFSPILPVPVDAPEPGSDFADPRLWQYEVGWNLPTGTPGSEGLKLADFATLRALADLYSVARACIQLRKNEIRGIDWDIQPTLDASKAMRGSHSAMKDFGNRRVEAIQFFQRGPDPDYFSWDTFLDALLEEVFVFDALSLLFRSKWDKNSRKGLLGSNLDSLSLINGPTIRPLLDMHGAKPRPPAAAYQQYLYGVPRSDFMTLLTERDIEEGNLKGAEVNSWHANQLLYLPMNPRRWTPYGDPPIERALIPVMSGLQKQGWQLDYYREGTVPAVYVSPGGVNSNMTPNQIRELQDALNAIAGDPAWKHKIIVLPADSKVMPQRQQELADAFDEVVMNQVCMAFDVQPMELGILPKVSTTTSPGAAHQMAKMTQDVQARKATKPTLTFIADIMDYILQVICKQEDMRFVFAGTQEEEDEETKTKLLVSQIGSGLRSIDEARAELQLQPWGLPETSDPGWATAQGWFPLVEAVEAIRTGNVQGPEFELPPGQAESTTALPTQQSLMPGSSVTSAPVSGTGAKPPAKPAAGAQTAKPSAKPASKPVAGAKPASAAAKPAAGAKKPSASAPGGQASPGHDVASASSRRRRAAKGAQADNPAVEAEFEALARHVRKGRLVSTWEPRHIGNEILARVSENIAKGLDSDTAIDVARRTRRVMDNGEEFWADADDAPDFWSNPAGGGGFTKFPHDAEDIQTAKSGSGIPVHPTVAAGVVISQLSENYPPESIEWVKSAYWTGPVEVPLGSVDFEDEDSWAAHRDVEHTAHFARRIEAGDLPHPAVSVLEPGDAKVKVIDGHHRTLAYRHLGKPALMYVGRVSYENGPWNETHSSQEHQGSDPANKSGKASKESVNYRTSDSPTENCGTCDMFRAPDGCTLVAGEIRPQDVCDEWDAVQIGKTQGNQGNPEALRHWFEAGAGGQINWGEPGDFDACVSVASEHMSDEQARGFCQLRHMAATGMATATHAAEERHGS